MNQGWTVLAAGRPLRPRSASWAPSPATGALTGKTRALFRLFLGEREPGGMAIAAVFKGIRVLLIDSAIMLQSSAR